MLEYYSEVAFALSLEFANVFEALLKHHEPFRKMCSKADVYERDTRGLFVKWDKIRWYPGLPIVDDFLNFLSDFEEEEYKFIRIGEESGDVEEFGCYETLHIRLSQRIEVGNSV